MGVSDILFSWCAGFRPGIVLKGSQPTQKDPDANPLPALESELCGAQARQAGGGGGCRHVLKPKLRAGSERAIATRKEGVRPHDLTTSRPHDLMTSRTDDGSFCREVSFENWQIIVIHSDCVSVATAKNGFACSGGTYTWMAAVMFGLKMRNCPPGRVESSKQTSL